MVAAGERGHYLSLALDARRALNALRAAEKNGEQLAELRDSIRAAAESLRTIAAHADLYAKHSPPRYTQYEEIQTLREVSSSFTTSPLLPSLTSLLTTEKPTRDDLELARKFFRALESRALHHYNEPLSSEYLTA